MAPLRTNRLDDEKLSRCPRCGDPIWNYKLPSGNRVALDGAPGEYVIDANNVAYKSEGSGGYRGHSDHCGVLAASPLTGEVNADDFLWR
jgi:hypothetical protein